MSQTNGTTDTWTYRRILDWTQQKLRETGSDSPRVEAEVLLAHAAGCQRIMLYTRLDDPTPDNVRAVMRELVQRRMKSEPVAYLVGHREFFGIDFFVTSDVLVPRPETETLVMNALDWLKAHPQRRDVLEIGVGSGCVSVTIAKQCDDASIVGVDVSSDALVVAQRNASRHGVEGRLTLLKGSCFQSVVGQRFDLIVSNPPYIRTDEMPGLDADVRMHEPRLALESGADGLDVVREIISQAPGYMTPAARLLMEIDPAQMRPVEKLLSDAGWTAITAQRDANGDERVIEATCPEEPMR